MSITYKTNSLKEYLYLNQPYFLRYVNNSSILYDETKLLNIRKNTNLEMIKKHKLIPNDYSLEDYHELIIIINKYKKKIQNKKYNKKTNIRSSEEYKINAREFSRLNYIENKKKHNKYCRLYFKTNNEIKEHNVKYNKTLIKIKKLDIQNTKTIREVIKNDDETRPINLVILSYKNT